MPDLPRVSVIVPTFNRASMLRELLSSLAQQSYPLTAYEVIIIDDGSTDETRTVAAENWPFTLRYIWQTNEGDAGARNRAAQISQAEILVFLDDDILVEPDYIRSVVAEHDVTEHRVVIGTMNTSVGMAWPVTYVRDRPQLPSDNVKSSVVPFTEVCSNSMSVRRQDYFEVGMMDSLGFSGSSMWCDVDFAYRASLKGFEFRRCNARYWHRDHVSRNVSSLATRMKVAAYRAVVLLQKYPDLKPHLTMFDDKTPIQWRKDSPRLMIRKAARNLASSPVVLWGLTVVVGIISQRQGLSALLPTLHRYIIGGHIFQGYRDGLRDFGAVRSRT
jgi:glycosyltransferase involved in cell wall biosynthesis